MLINIHETLYHHSGKQWLKFMETAILFFRNMPSVKHGGGWKGYIGLGQEAAVRAMRVNLFCALAWYCTSFTNSEKMIFNS